MLSRRKKLRFIADPFAEGLRSFMRHRQEYRTKPSEPPNEWVVLDCRESESSLAAIAANPDLESHRCFPFADGGVIAAESSREVLTHRPGINTARQQYMQPRSFRFASGLPG